MPMFRVFSSAIVRAIKDVLSALRCPVGPAEPLSVEQWDPSDRGGARQIGAPGLSLILPGVQAGPLLGGLPAVMSEGLVGLGHPVGIVALLDSPALIVGSVEQLPSELLDHRLFRALARVTDQPAKTE